MSCHCLATCGIDTMCDLFVSLLEQTSRLALAPNNREREREEEIEESTRRRDKDN